MKVTLADTSSGKTYQKELESGQERSLIGQKIGKEVKLDTIGFSGLSGIITGGSDKQGFPMRRDVEGSARKKILIAKSTGFTGRILKKKVEGKKIYKTVKGIRVRKSVRGNTVSDEIAQLNIKVTKDGNKLAAFFKKEEPVAEEKSEEKKE